LRVRQIQPLQSRDRRFSFADLLLCFQSEPDLLIDLVDSTSFVRRPRFIFTFDQFKKLFSKFFLLIGQRAGNDCALFIQPVKGRGEFTLLRFIYGQFVLLQPLPVPLEFCRIGILAADARQFGASESRIHFNRAQGVRCLDRLMLVCVAGEDDPAIVLFNECEQPQHLFAANLSSFVHEGRLSHAA